LLSTCVLLLFAGHETTTNLIGNGMLGLLEHPDELRRLEADPGLLPNAVEELVRFDGPVQATARRATVELELHGSPRRLPATTCTDLSLPDWTQCRIVR
jgi:cytochrome P450